MPGRGALQITGEMAAVDALREGAATPQRVVAARPPADLAGLARSDATTGVHRGGPPPCSTLQ